MNYVMAEDLRCRLRSTSAALRALATESPHEAAEELAASLRAMAGQSTYAVDAAKRQVRRKRVQAERERLGKLDAQIWMRQQIAISDAYRADMARYVASGCSEAVKSELSLRWQAAPGTKCVVPTARLLAELGVSDG